MPNWVYKIIFYGLILLSWQIIASSGIFASYIFPSPQDVFQALVKGMKDGILYKAIISSLGRVLIAYLTSIGIALILGSLLARFRLLEETLGSLVIGFHTLPSICWLPVSIFWFGLSDVTILFVVIMGSLFSLTLSIKDAIKNTPPIYIKAAKTMGAKGWKIYSGVILPAALPSIISGMKQGWSFAWRALMAGELLFVTMGLGNLLNIARELNDISQIFAVMFIIMIIGLTIDYWFFSRIETKIRLRWGLNHL